VLLVSHDRTFLNNVVTSTFAFEGDGNVSEYIGGYDDWFRQRPQQKEEKPKTKDSRQMNLPSKNTVKKMSFKEKKELETLPAEIEVLEKEQQDIYTLLADPAFYKDEGEKVASAKSRMEQLENDLPKLYERWEELSDLAQLKT
jgi:ATP-binding cassette subfamily F protein uup